MTTTNVLDHGYCNLVEAWGSDERIIEAARMSTDKGFLGWGGWCCPADKPWECPTMRPIENEPFTCRCGREATQVKGDEKLLRYLWEHNHHTPFEMAGAVFEIKAPIFVFREWHRHRTQSYNEMSARYIPLPDEAYTPSVDRLLAPGGTNKQAQGTGAQLTDAGAWGFQARLMAVYEDIQNLYTDALEMGVPKELARIVL